jgi:hypothetical protein
MFTLKVQRAFLQELLDNFIMSTLKKSTRPDVELGFGAGYLARLWPGEVRAIISADKKIFLAG